MNDKHDVDDMRYDLQNLFSCGFNVLEEHQMKSIIDHYIDITSSTRQE